MTLLGITQRERDIMQKRNSHRFARNAGLLAALSIGMIACGSTTPAGPNLVLVDQVNFQPSTTTTPTGYKADTGAALDISATTGMGWVAASSLSGTLSPLDMTGATRDRTGTTSVNQNGNTVPCATTGSTVQNTNIEIEPNNTTDAAWVYKGLANGTYQVTVGVGDVCYTDSTHQVRVNGNAATQFTFTPTAQTGSTGTLSQMVATNVFNNVSVTNNMITISTDPASASSTKTKLTHVIIRRVQ